MASDIYKMNFAEIRKEQIQENVIMKFGNSYQPPLFR